jgi:hypothetical protein
VLVVVEEEEEEDDDDDDDDEESQENKKEPILIFGTFYSGRRPIKKFRRKGKREKFRCGEVNNNGGMRRGMTVIHKHSLFFYLVDDEAAHSFLTVP